MHVQRRARSHGPRATGRRAARPRAERPRRSMPRDRSAPARPLPSEHADPRTATFSSLLCSNPNLTAPSTLDDPKAPSCLVCHGSRFTHLQLIVLFGPESPQVWLGKSLCFMKMIM
ncbi:unnamed protein product [Danaus chrysippus]|uniref:(African queen) hypothetical protein n=1 Tax=Danaus chrysippus TaxID=151541 RepID=A0A8J2QCN8_9NEOP|nr:unnamed protein product [Danaus chrysippus]